MPVRDKAVTHIAAIITGVMPDELGHVPHRTMTREQYDFLKLSADIAYERVVMEIDWNRVHLDATARHLSLHKDPDQDMEDRTLVEPSAARLAAAEDDEEERPYVPPPAWHSYRYDDICPECIMHAVLANEWGGKQADKWKAHPEAPRWRTNMAILPPRLRQTVLKLLAWAWVPPETAKPDELEDDGHMTGCREVGRAREAKIICDPRCPHYDGWVEDTTRRLMEADDD